MASLLSAERETSVDNKGTSALIQVTDEEDNQLLEKRCCVLRDRKRVRHTTVGWRLDHLATV